MSRVAIVDHGLCNLDSIRRAVEECGAVPNVTDLPDDVAHADRIVLPGVGAFADAMSRLKAKRLDEVMRDRVLNHNVPLLGICLGMQLLATKGSEGGDTDGLGLIDADVVRLEAKSGERLPHVGWNQVEPKQEHPLFKGLAGKDFYFVHSFHVRPRQSADVLATTSYCGSFTSAVVHGPVMGVQFHPEKSQKAGFALLKNFLAY